jgi:RNA polymerase sigma-70 factor (ECF subfamily)
MTKEEYNKTVKEHSNGLYRFILKMMKDEDKAEDVVQESYIKLWQHVKQVEFQKAKSWLYTTARNTMLNQIKRDKRMEPIGTGNFNEPYSTEKSYEMKELMDKVLDQLPELQRSIILLRDLEGYEYKEIGEILGLSESQVKVYLFRTRQKLKDMYKNKLIAHANN